VRLFDLFEEDMYQPVSEYAQERFFAQVETRCSDIIALYKQNPGKYFYRGTLNPEKNKFIMGARARMDRKPFSTTPELQNAIDMLMKGSGLQAVRSNSIFVTSRLETARGYSAHNSAIHIIFPVNGSKYSWSPFIRDLYVNGFRASDKATSPIINGQPAPTADELLQAAVSNDTQTLVRNFKWFQSIYHFTDQNLQQALATGNEVLVSGQYFGFPIGATEHDNMTWIDFMNGVLHNDSKFAIRGEE